MIFIQKNQQIVKKIFNKKKKKIFYFLEHETLDEFFNKKPDLPLLSINDYEPIVIDNNKSFENKSLVDYPDSD